MIETPGLQRPGDWAPAAVNQQADSCPARHSCDTTGSMAPTKQSPRYAHEDWSEVTLVVYG